MQETLPPRRSRPGWNSIHYQPYKLMRYNSNPMKILFYIARECVVGRRVIKHKEIWDKHPMDEMSISSIMRRLETTDLVYRPKRGYYGITNKGLGVVKFMELSGSTHWKDLPMNRVLDCE